MNEQLPQVLFEKLTPYAQTRIQRLRNKNRRLVHYTTAETALKVINSEQLWMRNASVMNDYSEIQHGHYCLVEALGSGNLRERFLKALNACGENLGHRILDDYGSQIDMLALNTYVACVSEHLPREDEFGRLSMWRAYGGRAGIAIIWSASILDSDPETRMRVFWSPVAYLDGKKYREEFERVVGALEANSGLLATLSPEDIKFVVQAVLKFATVSTKHPAFEEEREWRLIYAPRDPIFGRSDSINEEHHTIAGIPQSIYPIPLNDMSKIDRFIVGPCGHPQGVARALVSALKAKGIDDAEQRVVISFIPLRQPQ